MRWAFCPGDPNGGNNARTDGVAHSDAEANGFAHGDGHAYADAHPVADGDGYADTHGHSNANPHADPGAGGESTAGHEPSRRPWHGVSRGWPCEERPGSFGDGQIWQMVSGWRGQVDIRREWACRTERRREDRSGRNVDSADSDAQANA